MHFEVESASPATAVRWPDPSTGPWQVIFTWQPGSQGFEVLDTIVGPVDRSGGKGAPAALFKELPFGRLQAAARALRVAELGGDDVEGLLSSDHPSAQALGEDLAAQADVWRLRRSGRPVIYDDDHYKRVAHLYSEVVADQANQPGRAAPIQAIAQAYGVTEKAAQRWVKTARAKSFLPETTQGRARGNPPSS